MFKRLFDHIDQHALENKIVGYCVNEGDFDGVTIVNAEVYSRIQVELADILPQRRSPASSPQPAAPGWTMKGPTSCSGTTDEGIPMIKNTGTALLALGFVLLATAVLVRDPAALDADIGAGILSLAGLAVGALGLVLVVIGALVALRKAP